MFFGYTLTLLMPLCGTVKDLCIYTHCVLAFKDVDVMLVLYDTMCFNFFHRVGLMMCPLCVLFFFLLSTLSPFLF